MIFQTPCLVATPPTACHGVTALQKPNSLMFALSQYDNMDPNYDSPHAWRYRGVAHLEPLSAWLHSTEWVTFADFHRLSSSAGLALVDSGLALGYVQPHPHFNASPTSVY